MRRILRVDGSSEPLDRPHSRDEIRKLLGDGALKSMILWHMGEPLHVMLLTEERDELNQKATALYRKNHGRSILTIHGDVIIAPESEVRVP